jgi:hypothetical protein
MAKTADTFHSLTFQAIFEPLPSDIMVAEEQDEIVHPSNGISDVFDMRDICWSIHPQ